MPDREYSGLLLIGDPHLEGRTPGFRKDEYAETILEKLQWCLNYARKESLLPVILGDLFERPRDNPNWLIGRLLKMFDGEILGIYGNHDVHYNPELTPDDSLSLLVSAGRLQLVCEQPWQGNINGRPVVVGGSSYRQKIPREFDVELVDSEQTPLVVWLTHHDILIPGYDEGRLKPFEIPGVDLLVNGHIHRRLDDVVKGETRWVNPGNISRRTRSDASRVRVPSALRVDVQRHGYDLKYVEIPHRPFAEVFHDSVEEADEVNGRSSTFVAGLAELQARRTSSGVGLMEFLKQNVEQFETEVAEEIMTLAKEVTDE